jgi:hypothetical protein
MALGLFRMNLKLCIGTELLRRRDILSMEISL